MKNLFKKLFDTKFKKISWFVAIITIILCLGFIRTVPNYSKKYGFEIVSKENYRKYQQGYCLSEKKYLRNLNISDIHKAIWQFLDENLKEEILYNKLICEQDSQGCYKDEIGYYEIENITLENWYEAFYKEFKKGKRIDDIVKNMKLQKVNPKDYLIIDEITNTAGFSKPIIFKKRYTSILLDYDFFYDRHQHIIMLNHIKTGDNIEMYKKQYYFGREIQIYPKPIKFDNCGNIDYDAEKQAKEDAKRYFDFVKNGG
ncbi:MULTISPECIES: hypothetical protein [unclassified Campylobacter]|uniref:hypothetical protein n=1 Tax=unclassified Campylobacter TaxID=2593542 RepID=UPI0022E999E5|nr:MULTISPECIES: hypothetical protein [unclassified Campylobacter]MDA3042844.1 hypothetical protein [Campylobacter sp. JMF_09 ED2]MDA3044321.1 hypothetical protein [Campylobacter sp. JMF_07 ED4]MDA3063667.1 hypothetical protein [Campylobacter sp. JMF_11 EL3]MDA3071296.1 hypothetical protein [Campylobacter sp. VBCF_03 NA9]MDA3074756.1 hypothetical protein [Campylobacter sp. JMF_05 ED3]